MAQSMTKVMYLAAIAICAFSLQGCDDTGEDNKAEYKAAAAARVASEEEAADKTGTKKDETASTTVEKNNGCTEFQAAIKVKSAKEKMVDKIYMEIEETSNCPDDTNYDCDDEIEICSLSVAQFWSKGRLNHEGCGASMTLTIAQNVLFTVEKDPMFLAWTKDEKNKAAWDKVKAGPLNVQLETVLAPAVAVMIGKVGEEEKCSDWLEEQIYQVLVGTVEVFCPAYVEEVKEAVKEDTPLVDAEVKNEKNLLAAKVAATKEEIKVEEKTTLAPSVQEAAAKSQPSTDPALKESATEAEAAKTADGVADEVKKRRLAEIQI